MKLRVLAIMTTLAQLSASAVATADPGAGDAAPAAESPPAAIRWARRPDNDLMARIVPNGTAMQDSEGTATLMCVLTGQGWLKQCVVESESPKGAGLAALVLSLFFKFEAVVPGGAIAGREVRLPVNFRGGGAGEHNLVAAPIWLRAPTPAQVAQAYPAGKTGDGRVVFECQLDRYGGLNACRPRLSDPDDAGWVSAARQLLPAFKAPLQAQGGVSTLGARVLVPVQLLDPRSTEGRDSPIGNRPIWSRTPDAAEIAFPVIARAKGLRSGRGDVDCRVGPDWKLTDCRVAREVPEGGGFGEAALRAAAGFSLSAWSFDGRPVEGHRIRLPVGFVDQQAPAGQAPAN